MNEQSAVTCLSCGSPLGDPHNPWCEFEREAAKRANPTAYRLGQSIYGSALLAIAAEMMPRFGREHAEAVLRGVMLRMSSEDLSVRDLATLPPRLVATIDQTIQHAIATAPA